MLEDFLFLCDSTIMSHIKIQQRAFDSIFSCFGLSIETSSYIGRIINHYSLSHGYNKWLLPSWWRTQWSFKSRYYSFWELSRSCTKSFRTNKKKTQISPSIKNIEPSCYTCRTWAHDVRDVIGVKESPSICLVQGH